MMDQIRLKLERAQRRLARNAPSSNTSVGSMYIPSSEYNSAMHKPPVKSVLVEDMPATTARHMSSAAPMSMRPPPSRHGVPPPSRKPSKPDSRYQQHQYKSRSRYNHKDDADPLNGGPPPMSTPYLVYSSSKPPMTGSYKSQRPPSSRMPTSMMYGPPSALRSGVPKPPTSRVRFEGHESVVKESEEERRRRQQHMKEREARHQRHRQKELESINARANGAGPTSPIAATRERRSSSVEKPPGSAIDTKAFEEMGPRGRRSSSVEKPPSSAIDVAALETAPGRRSSLEKPPPSAIDLAAFKQARPRRSSINNPPPKSDIDIAAIEAIPRRRSSGAQENAPEPAVEQPIEEPVDEAKQLDADLKDLAMDSSTTDSDEGQSPQGDNQIVEAFPSPPPSVVPEPIESADSSDDGDTSGFESDSSGYSDFDVDSDLDSFSSGYSTQSGFTLTGQSEAVEEEDNQVDQTPSPDRKPEPEADALTPPASELSPVEEEEPQPRITARDLAFLALGRASSCSLSDVGSPVQSATGKESPKASQPPMSYIPASSAFPRSRRPMPATTGRAQRTGVPPPAPQTSGANYVRRSRARAPMDLKNQLPPSIGVLSGLSSGSSTFVVDPSAFYEVAWKFGEFAFSVQRVYTEANELDDRYHEPQLFLRMLLNTERSTCKSFRHVRVGDILIRVGDTNVSELGLEGGSGTVLTKFFARLTAQTPIKLTFQRMSFNEWEGGVEL